MTIDKRRVPARPGTLPDFAPVPRHYNRHDGWTDERQRGFIEALADTGSVKAAAHAVNMTPEGAYQLRRHPQAAGFRKAWEAALALGVQRLEDIAMERALHGVEVPVYSYGKLIGVRVVYNDRLLMFVLRNRAAARFAADGRAAARSGGSIGSPHATELSRLKRKWRKEWQAEQAANHVSDDEIRASIERKVADLRARAAARRAAEAAERERIMRPETRAALELYERLMTEDHARAETPRLPGPEASRTIGEDGE